MSHTIVLLVFGALILAQVLVVVWHECALWRVRRRPITEGTILSTRIDEVKDEHSTHYVPLVEYRYHVNGVSYTSDQFEWVLHRYENRRDAERRLKGLEPGMQVKVHHLTFNPHDAVVRVERPGWVWFCALSWLLSVWFVVMDHPITWTFGILWHAVELNGVRVAGRRRVEDHDND